MDNNKNPIKERALIIDVESEYKEAIKELDKKLLVEKNPIKIDTSSILEQEYDVIPGISIGGKTITINPLELPNLKNITNDQIVSQIKTVVEIKKFLNETILVKDILNEICIENNLELSDIDKEDILNNFKQMH